MTSIVEMQILQRDIPSDYTTRDLLEADARKISELAPAEFRQATYLYFLARYLVVVYEVSFAELPIQVWNEYRSALDHFFRHLTGGEANSSGHVKKMEGHLQRAVLDICKILCHDTESVLDGKLAKLHRASLALVDNGSFLSSLEAAFDKAQQAFRRAKTRDHALGDGADSNNAMLGNYLDAVYSYIKTQNMLRDRRDAIDDAWIRYSAIHRESAIEHVKLSLLSKLLWAVGSIIVAGVLFNLKQDALSGLLASWLKPHL